MAAGIVFMSFLMVSCLSDDTGQYEYSSDASITSFSLGTLKYTVVGKDKDGNDSLYTDTMSMANYPFTINQLTHRIENKDSLPVGTDISKVITNLSADSPFVMYGKIAKKGGEVKDTLWTNTDSIDFSVAPEEGLAFKVYSYNNTVGPTYYVKVNVHQMAPDSLQWTATPIGTPFASGKLTKQKAVYAGAKIYVFGENQSGVPMLACTSVSKEGQPGGWTEEELPDGTDTYSALACNGVVYFLASNKLYEIGDGGVVVSTGTPSNLSVLTGKIEFSDQSQLFLQDSDNKQLTYTPSELKWSDPVAAAETFPKTGLMCETLPVTYNSKLKKAVVMGYNEAETDKYGFVASRLTNDDSWTVYDYEKVDTFRCPNIQQPTLIYYDKKLCLFGGTNTSKYYEKYKEPFSVIFCSSDNGLTWKPQRSNLTFATPKDNQTFAEIYNEKGESYACAVDSNQFIWIVWSDGTMSRGRVNRFGFEPKKW